MAQSKRVQRMKSPSATLQELSAAVQRFCEKREWDQFHGPKDLSIAIATEASEVMELFRFKTDKDIRTLLASRDGRGKVADELADVLYFVLRFGQLHHIDLAKALITKLAKNAKKYPVGKARGSNKKYNEL